jgi:hypothetical protein
MNLLRVCILTILVGCYALCSFGQKNKAVNTEGVLEDIEIYKSVEFSLDEESVRMIVKSPRWTPAVQYGKKVKSYKRQPIVYRLPR